MAGYRRRRAVLHWIAANLVVALAGAALAWSWSRPADAADRSEVVLRRGLVPSTTTVEPTVPPTLPATTLATAPPPSTAAPTTTVVRRPAATRAPATTPTSRALVPRVTPIRPFTHDAYVGFAAWVDAFDWTAGKTNGNPTVGPAQIDDMANQGVQSLLIQTSRHDLPGDVSEPERLKPILARARARGMSIVAWYLPTLTDVDADLRRTLASASLDVDGIGIDIESRAVTDVAERNRRLVDYSHRLRAALPGRTISGIVLPPVVTDVINTNYWPAFPWAEIRGDYDLWVPMSYWTNRTSDSPYRDAYRYTIENIDRLRGHVGAGAVIHNAGGIGDKTTPGDIDGMVRAMAERGCIGGGIYDYRTTGAHLWGPLRALRR